MNISKIISLCVLFLLTGAIFASTAAAMEEPTIKAKLTGIWFAQSHGTGITAKGQNVDGVYFKIHIHPKNSAKTPVSIGYYKKSLFVTLKTYKPVSGDTRYTITNPQKGVVYGIVMNKKGDRSEAIYRYA
jgi:hypothetical protein